MPYIGAPEKLEDDNGGPLFGSDTDESDEEEEQDLEDLIDEIDSELPDSIKSEN